MLESIKTKTIFGLVWSAIESFSQSGIQFFINIIIARVLFPADYGMIGMLVVFLSISQIFIDSGFAHALIQKQNRNEADFSTVFYFNIAVALFLYGIIYWTAPVIADFYNLPPLAKVARVIALTLPLSSFSAINKTILTIRVDFKTQAKVTVTSSILAGGLGIFMAYTGFGVWALVAQSCCSAALNSVLFHIFCKWKPCWMFSIQSFKVLFSFGSKLFLARIIGTVYNNVYALVIGKRFHSTDLGYYTRADQFANFPMDQLSNILFRVTFPILSTIQDDNVSLKLVYRKYFKLTAFLVFPLMIGIAAIAMPLIFLLLTDKWVNAVGLLQILCFAVMWDPLSIVNLNLLYVKGRSDLVLKLEWIKKSIAFFILFISIPFGIKGMCLGKILYSIIAMIINMYYTPKIIDIPIKTQLKDLLPSLILALSMGMIVYLCIHLFSSYLLQILSGIGVGVIYYFIMSCIFKFTELKDLLSMLKEITGKR